MNRGTKNLIQTASEHDFRLEKCQSIAQAVSLRDSEQIQRKMQFGVMAESKPLIGLKWEPKLPGLSLDSKIGLCVPTSGPRKINKQVKDTTKSNWFDMPAPTMTPELKRDLQLLKLRTVMDPSLHYKKIVSRSKLGEKYFQIGTVVEPAQEFFGRLTKKNRKATLADELMSDPKTSQYRKRKVREIEEKNRAVQIRKGKQSKITKQTRNLITFSRM